MNVLGYEHYATEPDRVKPVFMCSFCNEQNMVVSRIVGLEKAQPIRFECLKCDYVWEWNVSTLGWDGYSLENGKWEQDD
jgi:transcription elongation factor Elf1